MNGKMYLVHITLGVIVAYFLIRIVSDFLYRIIYSYKINKKRIERFNNLKSKKCTGLHVWIVMNIANPHTFEIQKSHVCKECGYVPDVDGFCTKEEIENILSLSLLEENAKKRISKLAEKYNIDSNTLYTLLMEYEKIPEDIRRSRENG